MHWRNSNFQIRIFLSGRAHTPDEAYRVLRELEEERDCALDQARVGYMRTAGRIQWLLSWTARAIALIVPGGEITRAAAMTDIRQTQVRNEALVAEAERELAYIRSQITEIQPLRKFRGYPDHEAHQLAQCEQWRLELMWRVENYMAATGVVPPEQIEVMRLHPDWSGVLWPHMERFRARLAEVGGGVLPGHRAVLVNCPGANEIP